MDIEEVNSQDNVYVISQRIQQPIKYKLNSINIPLRSTYKT